MTALRLLSLLGIGAALPAAGALPADHAERMTRGLASFTEIAVLLKENCVNCHGGEKTKGDFDLATREGLLLGGKDGAVVSAFDSKASRLMKLLRHEEEPAMPDKKPKLSDEAIAKIAAWIDDGAPYATSLVAGKAPPRDKSKVTDADRAWWAFQPLKSVPVPAGAENPIDAFLLAKAAPKGLKLNPPAAPGVLARRASLILTGLPPSAEDQASVTGTNPAAEIGALADRLLASPHYGERWARHWLDVARFAESSGFEHDYDRPHAWHYRDFVIRAFNADMPWTQFIDWQLAGDEFAPGNAQAMMATGFLGAGVFPTQITANEVERVRYDALDDMLSTTGSAMLGLTVGCARCHDHKYDPIPTQDYYRLLSTFTTTVRSNIPLELDPERSAKAKAAHLEELNRMKADLSAWEARELRPAFDKWLASGPPAAQLSGWKLLEGEIVSKGGASFRKLGDGSYLAGGNNAGSDIYTFTVQNAGPVRALRVEALADESMRQRGPGRAANGNFALSRIRATLTNPFGGALVELKLSPGEFTHQQNNGSLSVASSLDDQPNTGWAVDGQIGKDQAAVFLCAPVSGVEARATLTVTLEFSVNTSHNIGRLRMSAATGDVPGVKETAAPAEVRALLGRTKLTEQERNLLWDWWKKRQPSWSEREQKIAQHESKTPKSTEPVMVCVEGYDPIVMHSQGPPFLQETHVLRRGDAAQKQAVATQSFLQVLMRGSDEKRWQWNPPAGAKSSGRRRSLAAWITDVEHGAGALMARVAVNRVWQHHFGRGIVATPNDFGKTGALPTHPELLDWLAGELIRNGWRLKPIHRLIMTSAAWRQSSVVDETKAAADPDNLLFLRATPRRLEAESVRDCILAVSGQLDASLYGKGTLDENSKRRSIYFTVKRSQLVNSMVVFDAPEPLVSQGSRPTTTVAPQALFLMNSPQCRAWAKELAAAVAKEPAPAKRVEAAIRTVLGRQPRPDEASLILPFLERQTALHKEAGKPDPAAEAFTDYCQTLFGLNEFLYIP